MQHLNPIPIPLPLHWRRVLRFTADALKGIGGAIHDALKEEERLAGTRYSTQSQADRLKTQMQAKRTQETQTE